MSAISGIGKVLGNLFKAGKEGFKAGSGFTGKAKGAWESVKGGVQSRLAGVAATNKRLAEEGFKSIGHSASGRKAYINAMRTEYGKRVGKAALAGGAFNALTGAASGEDTGLLGRFAKGAMMGAAFRGTLAGKYQGINLRKQFWSSNKALNSMISKEARYSKYAAKNGANGLSRGAWEKDYDEVMSAKSKMADKKLDEFKTKNANKASAAASNINATPAGITRNPLNMNAADPAEAD